MTKLMPNSLPANLTLIVAAVVPLAHPVLAEDSKAVVRLSEPVESTADYETFGASLDESLPLLTLSKLVGEAADHVGKPVRVQTRVAKVCQKKGCFFIAQDGATTVRVSFRDYGFFVPTDSGGKRVMLSGELVQRELTAEQARHFASDLNSSDDAIRPGKTYEIVATSVRIPRES